MTTNFALDSVKAASGRVDRHYDQVRAAIHERNALIVAAYNAGVSPAMLAETVGLTRQRIGQIIYDAQPDQQEATL